MEETFSQEKKMFNANGIIFRSEGRISFSDSEWVIATDITFKEAEDVLRKLENFLTDKSSIRLISNTSKNNNSTFLNTMQHSINNRAKFALSQFHLTKERFMAMRGAIDSNSSKKKRSTPLFGFGGKVLNFLFGVSTSDELDRISSRLDKLSHESTNIVHVLSEQATFVNETQWAVRSNTESINKIANSIVTLDRQMSNLDKKIENIESTIDEEWHIESQIVDAFKSIDTALNFVEQYTNNLDIGLASIADGKLPFCLFPPSQLRIVLNEIRKNLPMGWALTPILENANTWKAYQEAFVVAAAHKNGLRIFIHLPVFEFFFQFSLYKIFPMIKAIDNGALGITYKNLPEFLAISDDEQHYVEMNYNEANKCLLTKVCPFTKPIHKAIDNRPCSMALLTRSEKGVNESCVPVVTSWPGIQSLYLGQRTWAVSSSTPTKVVLTCPAQFGPLSKALMLSQIDVFETPMGCTAKSDMLIFQASFRKDFEISMIELVGPPNLNSFPTDESFKNLKNSKYSNISSYTISKMEIEMQTIIEKRDKSMEMPSSPVSKDLKELQNEDAERVKWEKELDKSPFTFDLLGMGSISFACLAVIAVVIACIFFRCKHGSFGKEMSDRISFLESKIAAQHIENIQLVKRISVLENWMEEWENIDVNVADKQPEGSHKKKWYSILLRKNIELVMYNNLFSFLLEKVNEKICIRFWIFFSTTFKVLHKNQMYNLIL